MPKQQHSRDPHRRRAEAPASRGIVIAETVLAIAFGGIFGATVAFVVNLVLMLVLWIAFRNLPSYSLLNDLGLGVLMSSALSLVAFGLLTGYAVVPARLALARMYAGLGKDPRTLADTARVRGRVDSSPFLPATVTTICIGSIACLAGIVCAVLLLEGAKGHESGSSSEVLHWSMGLGVSISIMLLCMAGVFVFHVLNRRWEIRVRPLLPKGAFGPYGKPRRRISWEEAARLRKARKRAYSLLDWCQYAGRMATAAGLFGLFATVLIRQPERYGPEVFYDASVENKLHALAIGSGALFFAGLIAVLGTGGLSVSRAFVIAGRVVEETHPVTVREQRIARTATKTLTEASNLLLALWFALPVLAIGCYYARDVLPVMNGTTIDRETYAFLEFDAMLPFLAWLGGLAAQVVLRAALEVRLPHIRNRAGYQQLLETPESPEINFR